MVNLKIFKTVWFEKSFLGTVFGNNFESTYSLLSFISWTLLHLGSTHWGDFLAESSQHVLTTKCEHSKYLFKILCLTFNFQTVKYLIVFEVYMRYLLVSVT